MESYKNDKQQIHLRGWLEGKGYVKALEAMNLGLTYHKGFRKDGVTPEFYHQVAQVNYLRTLDKALLLPEETYITCFLHDLVEDYNYSLETIEGMFGLGVAKSVDLLTKKQGYTSDSYYANMHTDACASIVKGSDRLHNQSSMVSVFSLEKIQQYLQETEVYILPMLKLARRKFAQQSDAYYNVKTSLISQTEMIHNVLNLIRTEKEC